MKFELESQLADSRVIWDLWPGMIREALSDRGKWPPPPPASYEEETIDFATQGRLRPLSGDDVWHVYLGRKMLRTFNQ